VLWLGKTIRGGRGVREEKKRKGGVEKGVDFRSLCDTSSASGEF